MKTSYEELTTKAKKRIRIIKGQLDGLQRMIERDEYCVEILNQSLAIQNSLRSLDAILFERHLSTHVPHQILHDKQKAIKELIVLFKRINK
ncbi:MAG: metal-sensitive transcriptional regulator [Patescibacteria group bacterium]|nr:metal-sensitive transcriptional regulator [Patescibacteria group bacterium]